MNQMVQLFSDRARRSRAVRVGRAIEVNRLYLIARDTRTPLQLFWRTRIGMRLHVTPLLVHDAT
jgi:hypothetical protein